MEQPGEMQHLVPTHEFFQEWLDTALRINKVIRIEESKLFDAIPIIRSALGDEWINRKLNQKSRVLIPDQDIHTLAQWIKLPNFFNVCSLVELANYLVTPCDVPGFNDVLSMLRSNNNFESSFFQLALAFRFST
jgi:hypothetical protein